MLWDFALINCKFKIKHVMVELKVITKTDLEKGILVLSPKKFAPLCKLKGHQVWIKDDLGYELFSISNDTDEKNLRFTGLKSWYQDRNTKVHSHVIITYNDGELYEKNPVIYIGYDIAETKYDACLELNNSPNLFSFATSELSQDAFFAWFLSWANVEYKKNDESLHKCSQDFLKLLIEEDVNIKKVEVELQWKKVDLFATVNDKYGIIIEDKVNAQEHNNQLEVYKERCKKRCDEEGLIPKYVFIKTKDNESIELNRKSIEKKGYKIIDREAILLHMRNYSISNVIFMNFKSHLQQIDIDEADENDRDNRFLEKLGGGELIDRVGKTKIFNLKSGDKVFYSYIKKETERNYNYFCRVEIEKFEYAGITHWCLFDSSDKRIFKIPVDVLKKYLNAVNKGKDIYIKEEDAVWYLFYKKEIEVNITKYLSTEIWDWVDFV